MIIVQGGTRDHTGLMRSTTGVAIAIRKEKLFSDEFLSCQRWLGGSVVHLGPAMLEATTVLVI